MIKKLYLTFIEKTLKKQLTFCDPEKTKYQNVKDKESQRLVVGSET